jgi:hypothetical protein
MKKHQGIPSFQSSLLLQSADDGQKKMQYQKNRRQKSNKEERSQDFPLFSDKYRAAPMYVGRPRRGRRIYWLNLPGDSPDRLFCFLRGGKNAFVL